MRYETLVARFWLRLRRVPQSSCRRQSRDKRQELWGRECERTQLNATHAQLLEKLRPIALAETRHFLAIQSLEFQEILQKNRSETT